MAEQEKSLREQLAVVRKMLSDPGRPPNTSPDPALRQSFEQRYALEDSRRLHAAVKGLADIVERLLPDEKSGV